ncbi:MAG: mannose-1-phosphate guanylyltransferase [Pirellulaceae bacterium]|nr:mannose-1-phosphate guanylyltransferase [Planctomycetales bacterium]
MLHVVIMAGGSGTRFWPASRSNRPKQLLDLAGDETMVQSTVSRLGSMVPPERVLIVTNEKLVAPIREQLPQLPPSSVLGEPCKRDTAPCIGLAAMWMMRHDDDATMAVMPSDHVIRTDGQFQAAIGQAAREVDRHPDRIVTFGISPTYPAESFGYIERGDSIPGDAGDAPIYCVERFREKPRAEVAREYLQSGRFYWNSGIFVWKARKILQELSAREPVMYEHLQAICNAIDTDRFEEVFRDEFSAIQGRSIDYAVMEHATDVAVIEAPFAWDDVGSWQALSRLREQDEQENTIDARHLGVDTEGSIIRGPDNHLIVTLGLKDCIVVHTPDATLVADKHQEERIREIVKLLEERKWHEYM